MLVAAHIQKFIAISHKALPLLFKKGLELGEVLDNDAHGDFTAPHGGKQLVEFIGQGNIRKLVHNEMHMDGQPTAVYYIRLIVELLEQLGIEHPHNKVKTGVIVGDHGKMAVFFSPKLHNSISSVCVMPASDSRLNFSSRDTSVIWMDFRVLPLPER